MSLSSSGGRTNGAAPPNWREYLIEAAGLGLFMISASIFAVLLEHPASPFHALIPSALLRRAIMGAAMGATAIALIYSPWGQRSGAHFNPAVTLTFFWLGKVAHRDLVGYAVAQFLGGSLGMAAASLAIGRWLAHPAVYFVVTRPGPAGPAGAFGAEFAITFILMGVVLTFSNTPSIARYTGVAAGACVALFITLEAPYSGMSLNPARTLASAIAARDMTALWVYLVAPPLGMIAAAAAYRARYGLRRVRCAKLRHVDRMRCIFCEYSQKSLPPETPPL
jgi:aquaporin Z